MPRPFARALVFAALVPLALPACGFRIAGSASLPPELGRIQLIADNLDRRQRAELRDRLQRAGAEVSEGPFDGATRLAVSLESPPDQRVVASSSRKTVKRVTRRLKYSLRAADGKPLTAAKTITQQRDVTVDDDNLLSSTGERKSVVEELERSLFDQLLRQLASL